MNTSGLHEYIDLMKNWEKRVFLVGNKGYRTNPMTFGVIRSSILALSSVLLEKNVQKGDRVILCGEQSPEWVIAFFAILYRGAVVVPLDKNTSTELITVIYKKTSPVIVISDKPPGEITVDRISYKDIASLENNSLGISNLEYKREGIPEDPGPPSISPDDTAEIVFTSGTTSDPKGVLLTHGNIMSNIEPIKEGVQKKQKLIKLITPFRLLCTVPYSHMFGQVTGIFLPIIIGSTVYFTSETGPASIARTIKRHRILTLITVPRVLKLLEDYVKSELQARDKLAVFERRWERWEKLPYQIRVIFFLNIHRFLGLHFWSFITGGAPLDPDTHEFWRRTVFSVFQGYGLTETAPMVTMFNPFKHDLSSVGKIMPGQEIRIGSDGEILVKGSNVMAGYYDDPESTAEVLKDGWLKTGDIGTTDSEGHVFIKGRKKDMIPTSDGLNVYAEDIEKVLNKAKGVREGIVVGLPDAGGETVHGVLLLEPGADPEKILSYVNSKLQPFQRIRGYSVWEEADFPRTPTLKIRKAEVLKKLTGTRKYEPDDENIFEGLVPGSVSPDSKLINELGLDSLDLAEAVSRIEKKYGTSIDEKSIGPETTVKDLKKLAAVGSSTRVVPIPRWAKGKIVKCFRAFFTGLVVLQGFRLFCKIKTHGLDNLTNMSEPGIFAANHSSDLDPLAVLLALPVGLRSKLAPAMGLNRFNAFFSGYGRVSGRPSEEKQKKLKAGFRKQIKHILNGIAYNIVTFLFQTYPFPQGAAYRASLEYTGELLDGGHWILIFPEGEVSETDEINRFRGGISVIAEKTGAGVYPVRIKGMRKVLPRGKRIPHRSKVDVFFGKPLYQKGYDRANFTSMVEEAVRGLSE
jgi:long-chain acyl-CoA synthetase